MSNVSRCLHNFINDLEIWTFSFVHYFLTYMPVLFQLIYKAHSKAEMSKVTTPADAVDIQRAKWAQQLTNKASLHRCNLSTSSFAPTDTDLLIAVCVCVSQQYIYTDLAAKERAHYTPEADTPNMGLARKMKVVYSDVSLLSFYCSVLCAVD